MSALTLPNADRLDLSVRAKALVYLFDLIHQDALIDVPVILAATGGGDKHCLVIEHSLRPLFAFLQAFAVPVGIYASSADFLEGERTTELVDPRILLAARQAVELVQHRTAARELPRGLRRRVPRARRCCCAPAPPEGEGGLSRAHSKMDCAAGRGIAEPCPRGAVPLRSAA
jgi:NADPH-dependent FMN reductase